MPTFKSKHKNELVYTEEGKVQFRNYQYTTTDKKMIAALSKAKGITKAETATKASNDSTPPQD